MPLKHDTETLLLVILGAAVLATGIVMAILPPLSISIVPWLIAFVIALAYPIALYPFLKSRRADYPFRLLHFAPAAMLLIWFLIESAVSWLAWIPDLTRIFSWGWGLLIIIPIFILLALFCWSVLRQGTFRLWLLAALLAPFVILALLGQHFHWNEKLASVIWPKLGVIDASGSHVAFQNLTGSELPGEEQWRARLRQMQRRSDRLQNQSSQAMSIPASAHSQSSVLISMDGSSSSSVAPPPHLSSSGPLTESMGLIFVAAYSGVLHQRMKKRMKT